MQFTLACILGKLVLNNGYYWEIVRLNSDSGIFDLDNKNRPREYRSEEVGQRGLVAIADNIWHIWDTVWDPLEAIRLTETASNH